VFAEREGQAEPNPNPNPMLTLLPPCLPARPAPCMQAPWRRACLLPCLRTRRGSPRAHALRPSHRTGPRCERPRYESLAWHLRPRGSRSGPGAAHLHVQEQRQDEDGGDGRDVERQPHDVDLLREQLAARGEAGRIGLRAEQARRVRPPPPGLLCGRCRGRKRAGILTQAAVRAQRPARKAGSPRRAARPAAHPAQTHTARAHTPQV